MGFSGMSEHYKFARRFARILKITVANNYSAVL